MKSKFSQQETQARDAEGNRRIKCEFCGKIAKESEFTSYGGTGHINIGICKDCSDNNPAVKFSSADEVYESIYKQAKSSIYVVDNYIGLRTLVHLKNSHRGVNIALFSDNVVNNKLYNIEFTAFCKEYPSVKHQ